MKKVNLFFLAVGVFLVGLLVPSIAPAPNRNPGEEKFPVYKPTEKGCEVLMDAKIEDIALFLQKVAESETLCKVETKNKGMIKKVLLPNQFYELDTPIVISNKDPKFPLEIWGPKVDAKDFPLAIFQPSEKFPQSQDGCPLSLGNGITLMNVMLEGFPGYGVCVVPDVELINVWLINNKTGVYATQGNFKSKKGVSIVESFFQKNSNGAIFSTLSPVNFSQNIFRQNNPIIFAPEEFSKEISKQFPLPEIKNVVKLEKEVAIYLEKGNPQLKEKNIEVVRIQGDLKTGDLDPLTPTAVECKPVPSTTLTRCAFPLSFLNEGFSAPYDVVSVAITYEILGGGLHTTDFAKPHKVMTPIKIGGNKAAVEGCTISGTQPTAEVIKFIQAVAETDMKCRVDYTTPAGIKGTKKLIHLPDKVFTLQSGFKIENNNSEIPIELRGPANNMIAGAPPTARFSAHTAISPTEVGLSLKNGVMLTNVMVEDFPEGIWINGSDVTLDNTWLINNGVAVDVKNPVGSSSLKKIKIYNSYFEKNINSINSNSPGLSLVENRYKNNAYLVVLEEKLGKQFSAPAIYNAVDFGNETHVNVSLNKQMESAGIELAKVYPNLQGEVEPISSAYKKCTPSPNGAWVECIFPSNQLKMKSGGNFPAVAAAIQYLSPSGGLVTTAFSSFYAIKSGQAASSPGGGGEGEEAPIVGEDPAQVSPPIAQPEGPPTLNPGTPTVGGGTSSTGSIGPTDFGDHGTPPPSGAQGTNSGGNPPPSSGGGEQQDTNVNTTCALNPNLHLDNSDVFLLIWLIWFAVSLQTMRLLKKDLLGRASPVRSLKDEKKI